MPKFAIQETKTLKSNGARCSICGKLMDYRDTKYRVLYGKHIHHLSCFYSYIKNYMDRTNKTEQELKQIYAKLEKHMPQILAESIEHTNKPTT